MSLLKCPECGKMISSLAEKCPECGYPLSKYIDSLDGMISVYDKKISKGDEFYFEFTKIDNFNADNVEVISKQHQIGGDFLHQVKYYNFLSKIDEKELITDEKGFKYVSNKYPKKVIDCSSLYEYLSEKHKYSNEIKKVNDKVEISEELKVGKIVEFGNYQGEKLQWIVVDVDYKNTYATLLSYKIIDFMQYDTTKCVDIDEYMKRFSYLNSSIRKWLTNDFFNSSFSEEEKKRFVNIKHISKGYITEEFSDFVYLPSKEDVEGYLNEKLITKVCKYSKYAEQKFHDYCKNSKWLYEHYSGTWFVSNISYNLFLQAKLATYFKCDNYPFETYTGDDYRGIRPEITVKTT